MNPISNEHAYVDYIRIEKMIEILEVYFNNNISVAKELIKFPDSEKSYNGREISSKGDFTYAVDFLKDYYDGFFRIVICEKNKNDIKSSYMSFRRNGMPFEIETRDDAVVENGLIYWKNNCKILFQNDYYDVSFHDEKGNKINGLGRLTRYKNEVKLYYFEDGKVIKDFTIDASRLEDKSPYNLITKDEADKKKTGHIGMRIEKACIERFDVSGFIGQNKRNYHSIF